MTEAQKDEESPKTSSEGKAELKKRIEELESNLRAVEHERKEFVRTTDELQSENEDLKKRVADLDKKLAVSHVRSSRMNLIRIETWTNSLTRAVVIFTFAIVGPILLAANLASLQVNSVLADIFKIWLGAAIGISTNLLQRTEKLERTPYSKEEEVAASKKEDETKT